MAQPTPIVFTMTMPGEAPVRLALQRFTEGISDWTLYWQDYFLPAWYRSMGAQFETQGASSGDSWPALNAKYAAWKQRHWPGLPTNVLSGALRESLTFPDDPNAVMDITPTSLRVGTSVSYGTYVQMGTRRIPRRPVLRLSESFAILAARLLQEFGVKTAKEAGLK